MVRNDPTCLMQLRSEQIQLRLMDLPKVLGRQDLRLFLWSRSTGATSIVKAVEADELDCQLLAELFEQQRSLCPI